MKILFQRAAKANLPEIDAYMEYIKKYTNYEVYDSNNVLDDQVYDVIWKFMGTDFYYKKSHSKFLVHEYASLSIGKNSVIKDQIKKIFNKKPDLRIFLNTYIEKKMGFKDEIVTFNRDMGIKAIFFEKIYQEKKYDFVYIGEISKERNLHLLLENMIENQYTFLFIGRIEEELFEKYKKYKQFTFLGLIPQKEIPFYAKQAEYALNLIPNIEPYNQQTSTKLLEYCALGLKIVSSKYYWVEQFEKNRNAQFYYFDYQKFNFIGIEKFNFVTPDVKDLEWNTLLSKTPLLEILKELEKKVDE